MICDWQKIEGGVKCRHCGTIRDKARARNCTANLPKPTECPHLLDPLGESVTLYGCGCSSSKKNGIDASVWGCDLFGKCVRQKGTHVSDPVVKLCHGCESNPNRIAR